MQEVRLAVIVQRVVMRRFGVSLLQVLENLVIGVLPCQAWSDVGSNVYARNRRVVISYFLWRCYISISETEVRTSQEKD